MSERRYADVGSVEQARRPDQVVEQSEEAALASGDIAGRVGCKEELVSHRRKGGFIGVPFNNPATHCAPSAGLSMNANVLATEESARPEGLEGPRVGNTLQLRT